MKRTYLIILGIVILIATFFRFYNLDIVPPSASLDEVSLGWNAYSILQTGKDEYGEKFPILLRAYDDYRPALYVYTVIPFIKTLGLNVLSVRLPSAIFSILTVLATYFLVKELFKKSEKEHKLLKPEYVGLVSAFLLAISPWHIYISRLGHEVNLGLSFAIFGMLFFLKKNIYLSALFFVLSFMSYQTEKIFIPLFAMGLFFIFKEGILKMKRKIIVLLLFSLIILVPFIRATLSENALIRFSGTNVLEQKKYRFVDQFLEFQRAASEKDLIGQFINNRRILAGQILAEGYFAHFNPAWLFTNEMGDPHKVPNLGLLYIWELPFILIGIYVLIRYNFDPKIKKVIFLWFLLAPVAASLATQSPHALRSFTFLPTWQIFSSLGFLYVSYQLRSKRLRKLSIVAFLLIILLSISYLFNNYFSFFPRVQAESFQLSLKKAIDYVKANEDLYYKVIFTNHNSLAQSYMFFLFYNKYDPKLYLREGGTVSGGYETEHKFGKYEFRKIDIPQEEIGNLFIGNYYDFPTVGKDKDSYKTLKVFTDYKERNLVRIATK